MNCVSIAIYPPQAKATIKRVIEYFCPNDRHGSRIWVDIFIDNPSIGNLKLKMLHAGSLSAVDVTKNSWGCERTAKDDCASVLTNRIRKLHDKEYFPIVIDDGTSTVHLGKEKYHIWKGKLEKIIGDDPSFDVPFTMWQIDEIAPGKSVLRICLEMQKPTYQRRFGNKTSFFAYGEAVVLRNLEYGDLPSYRRADADKYKEEFENFTCAHKRPEAFEYLIVSPEGVDLTCNAVPLSASMSPKFIRSGELARNTLWFTAESSDSWEIQANVIEINKLDEIPFAPAVDPAGVAIGSD